MTSDNPVFYVDEVPTQQKKEAVLYLETLIPRYPPQRIVELGTGYGGFTKHLLRIAPTRSYDNVDRRHEKAKDVQFCLSDIFDPIITAEIERLINEPGRTWLFCDNGNKPLEVLTFLPMLKPGDILIADDFPTELNEHHIKMATTTTPVEILLKSPQYGWIILHRP